ncbi:MAG: peptidyl-prolyl cis-trans isomerase, partial [Flavisolibacter sp.]
AFENKIKMRESQYRELNDETRTQIMQTVWDEEVNGIILSEEFEKLGLTVTDKELNDVLYGANPPQFLAQNFTDANGKFDANTAKMRVNEILKTGSVQQKTGLAAEIENIKKQRLLGKYMALLTSSIYMGKWFFEKLNVDNSLIGKFSYVNIPYSSIPDSAVKVTDDEIKDYMEDHKSMFEQPTETRSINYVAFNASASAKDSAATKADVENSKNNFATTTDPALFVAQQNSLMPFFDGYTSQTAMQFPAKDSVIKLAKGEVYGPYLDNNSYVLARMMDIKMLPDSVKCRHILIGTADPQTGQPLFPDSIAKVKIDSIEQAIKNGASFDTLNMKYSTDERAKMDKGVMTFSSTDIQGQNFAKPFGQFILFDGKPGDKKVVKTDFGWHYIEIIEHKNVVPHNKVAYLAKQIIPSQETDQEALNQANLFAGDSRDIKSFNENFEKNLKGKGLNKSVATDMGPMDNTIMGLPPARAFIRLVFEGDEGDVVGPERVGENYVVAVITEVTEPGLKSVNSVRSQVEPKLRDRKKAAMIIKNIGKVTSLEDVAAKNKAVVDVVDSVRFGGNSKLGFEPRVSGAVFNPANKGKVIPEAIAGNAGVYVIRVESTSTTPVETADIEAQRSNYEMQMKQSLMNQFQRGINPIVETLKRGAKIKDNRAEFY